MIVYKVVRIQENKYTSLYTDAPDLSLEYKIGVDAIPVIGPIFAYQKPSDIPNGTIGPNKAILVCESEPYTKPVRTSDTRLVVLLCVPEVLKKQSAEKLWNSGEISRMDYHTIQSEGVALCRMVRPIQVYERSNQ